MASAGSGPVLLILILTHSSAGSGAESGPVLLILILSSENVGGKHFVAVVRWCAMMWNGGGV